MPGLIFFVYELYLFYRVEYDSEGGRRSAHLLQLVDFAKNFTHVFVIVGDNDVAEESIEYILGNFVLFLDAVWPTRVKFAGNMRRRDLDPVLVSNNNIFLSDRLGKHYKSTKLIKREDFHYNQTFHFDRNGEGHRHMAALILSVLDEFVMEW